MEKAMDIFKEIISLKNSGTPAMLATVVEVSGSAPGRPCARMLVKPDGSIVGTIGGGAIEKKVIDEAMQRIHTTESTLLRYNLEELDMTCGGDMTVFLEPLEHPPDLIIFGAGHIGSALSKIAKILGFTVTVVDNRPDFAQKEKLSWADKVIADDYHKALQELVFSDTTYLVILTHRHVHDVEILEHCARQSFRYLGMIGSQKKVTKAFQQLRDNAIGEETIKRIHAPVGIGIGADTPAEIAISIAAQLVAERSDTKVPSLKLTTS